MLIINQQVNYSPELFTDGFVYFAKIIEILRITYFNIQHQDFPCKQSEIEHIRRKCLQ